MKYEAGSKFDFENLHRDKFKQCRERVFMVQLDPNDRFFSVKGQFNGNQKKQYLITTI